MTVDNLLLKLKDFDKNLIVCISKNPWNAYTISNVSRRPYDNTIILERTLSHEKVLDVRQLVKHLLELPSNAEVTFIKSIQIHYVKSMDVWDKYLILD